MAFLYEQNIVLGFGQTNFWKAVELASRTPFCWRPPACLDHDYHPWWVADVVVEYGEEEIGRREE